MKINNKILGAILGVSTLLISSCDDGDKVIDTVFDETTRGAVLRTIEADGIFDRFDTSTTYGFTFEEQDYEDGDLLEKVDLYISFEDNTEANGDSTVDEILIETFLPADFTDGEFGLPRASYETTLANALSQLGLVEGDFDGGDAIQFRLILTLTDGRTFTNDDSTGTITGSFFNAPYFYAPIIKCIPPAPVAGEYTIEMEDSYGDGWNGASIDVVIDGVETSYTLDSGAAGSQTFTVPEGTAEFTLAFSSGDWDGEITYEIIAPTGELALSDGPTPAVGVQTLNICGG
ncbi:MAG: hypothetical protein ABJO28_01570 [Maribacter dokdonensis]|jgi:hypothetical protein|uniref:Uncharacterized protein n=2 Tax=Maribacter dokdonensis TaxID=320912 RepID=A0A1H4N8V1_9FLAO|nr:MULTISPECIES: hypothetical protein [Maribacter]APA64932.1 hypothetical protein YQ22_11735 [Maribacter sp. 1_2014MBL_MicDiv]MDP2525500.1 hypothetical protein [Maribacter dokdonensis]CAG2534951.1 hypothetical protein MAR621_00403 [Maribacter dokdonensis]SEB91547.1 hypothetical protein SAMN05192540_1880 [Maribacter dokdonensis]